jgi:hypothetical protein
MHLHPARAVQNPQLHTECNDETLLLRRCFPIRSPDIILQCPR